MMNTYLNDMMAFADLLAACNLIHEEAVTDADGYDGGVVMHRIAEVHRRLKAADSPDAAEVLREDATAMARPKPPTNTDR